MPRVNSLEDRPVPNDKPETRPSDISVDIDNPEWTAEEFASARPFAEVFPELMQGLNRSRGRPVAQVRKQQISIRLDAEVVERFKATGKGWQARINDILKQAKL